MGTIIRSALGGLFGVKRPGYDPNDPLKQPNWLQHGFYPEASGMVDAANLRYNMMPMMAQREQELYSKYYPQQEQVKYDTNKGFRAADAKLVMDAGGKLSDDPYTRSLQVGGDLRPTAANTQTTALGYAGYGGPETDAITQANTARAQAELARQGVGAASMRGLLKLPEKEQILQDVTTSLGIDKGIADRYLIPMATSVKKVELEDAAANLSQLAQPRRDLALAEIGARQRVIGPETDLRLAELSGANARIGNENTAAANRAERAANITAKQLSLQSQEEALMEYQAAHPYGSPTDQYISTLVPGQGMFVKKGIVPSRLEEQAAADAKQFSDILNRSKKSDAQTKHNESVANAFGLSKAQQAPADYIPLNGMPSAAMQVVPTGVVPTGQPPMAQMQSQIANINPTPLVAAQFDNPMKWNTFYKGLTSNDRSNLSPQQEAAYKQRLNDAILKELADAFGLPEETIGSSIIKRSKLNVLKDMLKTPEGSAELEAQFNSLPPEVVQRMFERLSKLERYYR